MILLVRALLTTILVSAAAAGASSAGGLKIVYAHLQDDPRHAEQETYTNIVLRPAIDPALGAETAVKEARIIGRAIGTQITLERAAGADAADLSKAVRNAAAKGARFFLLDASSDVVAEVARQTRDAGVYLLNTSAVDDSLRGEECQPHLLHVAPSRSMLTDALAQHVVALGWDRVLVLEGPLPEDAALVASFERSAGRFGLQIVDHRTFDQGNDPRDRARNNIRLLTGDAEYDLIFVADHERGRGREIAYNSGLPRPVIGTEGLVPAAWHWAYERHGAPQLNQRFERAHGRRMTDADWGAWAAVSLIAKAAAAAGSADPERIAERLLGPELTFDSYKGAPGSFRPWNNQLRQPVLLGSGDAVAGRAPLDPFLHQVNVLDTLGYDEAESRCRM